MELYLTYWFTFFFIFPVIEWGAHYSLHLFNNKLHKNHHTTITNYNINKKEKNLVVSKYKKQGSGMISSMVFSDGILEIPEDINLISKNDYFNFYSFEHLFD